MALKMPRLSSSDLKHRLWRAAISTTPLPAFARPRESAFWQRHWREKISDAEFPGYAASTDLKKWFARRVVDLSPTSVLELGCNVGANLREIGALDNSVKLYGIELNARAIAWAKGNVVPPDCMLIQGSMANTKSLMKANGSLDASRSSERPKLAKVIPKRSLDPRLSRRVRRPSSGSAHRDCRNTAQYQFCRQYWKAYGQ